MEEDTPKIQDTTGTVFIQGPSIVLSLGGPSHGARVWCLLIGLARRTHSAKLLHGYGMLRSVLHKARSDNAQEFSGSHKVGHSDEVDHQHRP